MQIRFLGHSSFLIIDNNGTRIITDPYHTGPEFLLAEIDETADVVTVSHQHPDHNNTDVIGGNPQVLTGSASVKGITFTTVDSYHDNSAGKERGGNLIFVFEVDGLKVCHLGDLGHQLDKGQVAAIGRIDVLFVPVGGGFTIDVDGADKVSKAIGARVMIPMHYKTAGLPFLADIDEFLNGKDKVTQNAGSTVEITSATLPENLSIMVLKPELYTG